MQEKKRFAGPDVVRCVALMFIIGVHFFLYNGFYFEKQVGVTMLVADTVRWLTFSCVPMFIILTGYLKAEAKLSWKFYKGIVPILVTWFVVSVICILFKKFCLGNDNSLFQWLVDFVNFKGADYSWYIELYIGMFLLIPFLNQFFAWEKDLKYHVALVVTLIVTAFVPSLLNGIVINGTAVDIIPNYFVSLWPFAYYFIGCFLRKYQFKFNTIACLGAAFCVSLIKGLMSFISAYEITFYKGIGGGYSDFYVAAITTFMFMAFYKVKVKHKWLERTFAHVSKRALHIYLLSSIADAMINIVQKPYNNPEFYWWTFPVRCVAVFVISLVMAEVVYPITNAISRKITEKKIVEVEKNLGNKTDILW